MLFMRADRVVRLYAPSTGRAPQSLPCAKGGGTAFGRDGGRDADAPHPRCLSVGEGLCPSRGRGRTPPLRPSTDGLHVIRAGRCGHRPLHSVCRWRVRVYSGRTESSAPTLRLPGVHPKASLVQREVATRSVDGGIVQMQKRLTVISPARFSRHAGQALV